jgi:hypothetical protein
MCDSTAVSSDTCCCARCCCFLARPDATYVLHGLLQPLLLAATAVLHGMLQPLLLAASAVMRGQLQPLLLAASAVLHGQLQPLLLAASAVLHGQLQPLLGCKCCNACPDAATAVGCKCCNAQPAVTTALCCKCAVMRASNIGLPSLHTKLSGVATSTCHKCMVAGHALQHWQMKCTSLQFMQHAALSSLCVDNKVASCRTKQLRHNSRKHKLTMLPLHFHRHHP